MVQTNSSIKHQEIYVSPQLKRAEKFAGELSLVDQLWLMEWLAQHIRETTIAASRAKYDTLAVMAGDPDIQREIHDIHAEFAIAEADGLDKYQ